MFLLWRNRLIVGLLFTFFSYLFACHQAMRINLTAVDIGRHLKNGQLILSGQFEVLYKNVYSFTFPDYQFINHHWLAGVIFELIHRVGGWEGLGYFYIALMLAAFVFFYLTARQYASFGVVLLLSMIAISIMCDRREIRPEGFSVLFLGIYFYTLSLLSQSKISLKRALIVLLPIQILWVNIHIFFFLGPLLVLAYLPQLLRSWVLLPTTLLVNLINPSGLAGALTPLNGFKTFGYNLAENQSILFMINRFPGVSIYPYELGLIIVAALACLWWLRSIKRQEWLLFIFIILAGVAGFKAVRLMSPFAFIWIVLLARVVGKYAKGSLVPAIMAACLMAATLIWPRLPIAPPFGLTINVGLTPKVQGSAQFFKDNHLKGPIFSNYDIGGYLIYHLYPQEKVFVDNRQEAFPSEFFKETYIPMQENHDRWAQEVLIYHFQLIYFYRHDLTPWGQEFLIRMVDDQFWAPIFVDDYVIIFARRDGVNQAAINQYELPRSMFGVHQN